MTSSIAFHASGEGPALDQEVERFVQTGADRARLSVIVEAKASQRSLRAPVFGRSPGAMPQPRPHSREPSKPAPSSSSKLHLNEIGKALENFGIPEPPVRLDSAEAYVAELSPREIRELATSSYVSAIRLNRRHFT